MTTLLISSLATRYEVDSTLSATAARRVLRAVSRTPITAAHDLLRTRCAHEKVDPRPNRSVRQMYRSSPSSEKTPARLVRVELLIAIQNPQDARTRVDLPQL